MGVGRKLPKYRDYYDKLVLYIAACELTLERREVGGDGEYIPNRRVIALDIDLDESSEIAILLHELAHSFDDALANPKTLKKLDKAYSAMFKNEANEKQAALILECEKRAWTYGRAIAKKLRIPLGAWYDKEEKSGLEGYVSES
jgi:hypothetical protein